MLPMTYAELLNQPNSTIADTLPSMSATLWQVLVMVAIPSILAGVVGSIIASRKIKIPKAASVAQQYKFPK